jgi:hypothetical protein
MFLLALPQKQPQQQLPPTSELFYILANQQDNAYLVQQHEEFHMSGFGASPESVGTLPDVTPGAFESSKKASNCFGSLRS